MPKLLKIKDIAEQLQVTAGTVYKWVEEKKIPYSRMPTGTIRFEQARIDQWLKQRQVKVNISGVFI